MLFCLKTRPQVSQFAPTLVSAMPSLDVCAGLEGAFQIPFRSLPQAFIYVPQCRRDARIMMLFVVGVAFRHMVYPAEEQQAAADGVEVCWREKYHV